MKNTNLWIRTGFIVILSLVAIYFVFGPRQSVSSKDLTWEGIKTNLSNNINLGLDLRGGSHLMMQVQIQDYLKTLTVNNKDAAVNAAKEAKLPVGEGSVVTEKGTYSITINFTDPSRSTEIVEAIKKKVDLTNWTETINPFQLN